MRAGIAAVAAIALASCSTLDNIHDPQFGLLSPDQVPELIKSVRCELITFYAANAARKRDLDKIRASIVQRHMANNKVPLLIDYNTVLANKYFDLDTDLYGAFVLEAKVLDTETLLSTSSPFTNVIHSKTGNSQTLTLGPNLSAQGTYDMNYNYAIQQDDTLSDIAAAINEDQYDGYSGDFGPPENPTQCYRAVVIDRYVELAAGKYPALERFRRIAVNGTSTLATWLQQNTTTMGAARNILKDAKPVYPDGKERAAVPVAEKFLKESVDPGQMSYIFTVQYTAGIDAKFSLVSPAWNPLTTDSALSSVQTGVLSVYVNGYMAGASLGAKSGTFAIAGRTAPAVQQVFVVNGNPPTFTGPTPPKHILPVQPGVRKPPSSGPNRGQPLFQVTPFTLTPGP